jgi:hypothetical protein
MDLDSTDSLALSGALPRAAKQIDSMAVGRDSPEDFCQMQLGSACLRILLILPVENEYPH